MDRFIECKKRKFKNRSVFLKSNMDRFIAELAHDSDTWRTVLKSNMDRFIVALIVFIISSFVFKIQYG